MQRSVPLSNAPAEFGQLGDIVEIAGADCCGYADDVLRHRSTCAKVQVAHFAVAHLAAGKAHRLAGCFEQSEGGSMDEAVPYRGSAEGNCVAVRLGSVAPSVQHDQDDRAGPPSGAL